jgi:hypothetical protein
MPTPPQIPIPRFIHYKAAPAEQQLFQPVFSSLSAGFQGPSPFLNPDFGGYSVQMTGKLL